MKFFLIVPIYTKYLIFKKLLYVLLIVGSMTWVCYAQLLYSEKYWTVQVPYIAQVLIKSC